MLMTIESGEDSCVYRLSKETEVFFIPSPDLSRYQNVKFYVDGIETQMNWPSNARYCFKTAGPHKLCLKDAIDGYKIIWSACILVDPKASIDLNNLRCCTVISKLLGQFNEWMSRLEPLKKLGYNAIHFTPLQQPGASNSPFSIFDHSVINGAFNCSLDDIGVLVNDLEKKSNILSITDIVLNHVSSDCEWIRQLPNATFNLNNTKHLRPAFMVDLAISKLQDDLISGRLEKSHQLSSNICCENDITAVSALLRSYYIPLFNPIDYYMIDVESAVVRFLEYPKDASISELKVDYSSYTRFGANIISIPEYIQDVVALKDLILDTNKKNRNIIENHLTAAINNVASALRCERLDPKSNLYQAKISLKKPIVAPYFSGDKFKVMNDLKELDNTLIMANNGWVFGRESEFDFTSEHANTYLRRELVAWGDCIKLRYGSSKDDCPELWSKMEQYTVSQAKIFAGFRLDNCHSTPIHVSKYMIAKAREVNEDLIIMAELFASESILNKYIGEIGINAIVAETMHCKTATELSAILYKYGGLPIGSLSSNFSTKYLVPSKHCAIVYDQHHDNEPAIQSRGPQGMLAFSCMIAMANCPSGSVRGYDELYENKVDIVYESKLYSRDASISHALLPMRHLISTYLSKKLDGFSEAFYDSSNENIITITRSNPTNGKRIVMLAQINSNKTEVHVDGIITRVLFEFEVVSKQPGCSNTNYSDDQTLSGRRNVSCNVVSYDVASGDQKLVDLDQTSSNYSSIKSNEKAAAFVIALEVDLYDEERRARDTLANFDPSQVIKQLSLNDINYILFSCEAEEGAKPYQFPNHNQYVYCGLRNIIDDFDKIRRYDDMAHPVCCNIRDGPWLFDYIVSRLKRRASCEKLAGLLKSNFDLIHPYISKAYRPKYTDLILKSLYDSLETQAFSMMPKLISASNSDFIKRLALASIALVGDPDQSSSLLPTLDCEKPPSISAGLPHFSTPPFRNWGRDTFISLNGLMLLTGRREEAKAIILSYSRLLKHGLIPNLLLDGQTSRYNSRDAVWWWLYSIKQYCESSEDKGVSMMKEAVVPIGGDKSAAVPLSKLIQQSLQEHFDGISFREDNAGPKLDAHMTDLGFNVSAGICKKTGFVVGGNQFNCGTWMDKMGIDGTPATPRDGSAIELSALCKSIVSWLSIMNKEKIYPYAGVNFPSEGVKGAHLSWLQWANMIQQNFESCFYIRANHEQAKRTEIYKDTYNSTRVEKDYQFRPNFLIAIVVAPELFNSDHAKKAIKIAGQVLLHDGAVRTLDPLDEEFRPIYNLNDTSEDKYSTNGFNYHNGPAWVWLTGFYLRALKLFFGTTPEYYDIVSKLHEYACQSPWFGLPEVIETYNACPIQSWSVACALEAHC